MSPLNTKSKAMIALLEESGKQLSLHRANHSMVASHLVTVMGKALKYAVEDGEIDVDALIDSAANEDATVGDMNPMLSAIRYGMVAIPYMLPLYELSQNKDIDSDDLGHESFSIILKYKNFVASNDKQFTVDSFDGEFSDKLLESSVASCFYANILKIKSGCDALVVVEMLSYYAVSFLFSEKHNKCYYDRNMEVLMATPDVFIKFLRQSDGSDSGHADMFAWHSLNHSIVFEQLAKNIMK